MKTVSAAEANREFSKLLRDVQQGETVTITSRGKPVARMVAIDDAEKRESDRGWLELVDSLKRRPALNMGKFDRNWAYED